jgi:hypothetical protein
MRRILAIAALAAVGAAPLAAHATEYCTPGDGYVVESACAGADPAGGDGCADPTGTLCGGIAGIKPKKNTIWFRCSDGTSQQGRPCDILRKITDEE